MTRTPSSFADTRTIAFVLDEKQLESLFKLIKGSLGSVSLEVTSADGVTLRLQTLKDESSMRNPRENRIAEITINGDDSSDPRKNISVTFNSYELFNARIRISGPEDWLRDTLRKTEAIISGMRPWYARIALAWWYQLAFVSAIVILPFYVWIYRQFQNNPPPGSLLHFLRSSNVVVFEVVVFIAVLIEQQVQRAYFPMSTFSIGDGARRHKTAEAFRFTCIVGLVISIAGSIAGTALWSFFFN